MGTDYNTIDSAPEFNPHRTGVAAAETGDVTNPKYGVNGAGFDNFILDLRVASGTLTAITLQVLYWSPASGKFVAPNPVEEVSFTGPGQVIVQHAGRIFLVRVKTIAGISPVVDVYISGTPSNIL